MKLADFVPLIQSGDFATSPEWRRIDQEIQIAIARVVWPPGNDRFTIHPQSGKKRGEGNGVTPIKRACMDCLHDEFAWELEARRKIGAAKGAGPIDAIKHVPATEFALEWETGNISSSHRSLNKMALGMMEGVLCGGAIILPTRRMYNYLTDRVGNYQELIAYIPFWRRIVTAPGVLAIYVVEHDAEDLSVPRIAKGTDGRAML